MTPRPRSPDGYYEWHEETKQWMPVPPPEQEPTRPPTSKRRWMIAAGVLGLTLLIGIISFASMIPTTTPTKTAVASPEPTAKPVASAAPVTAATPVPKVAATAAPAAAPKVVLPHFQGNGIKTTTPFSAPGQWKLSYAYDCTGAGGQGNFQVMVYDGSNLVDIAVNELGKGGTSSTTVYHGGSNLHLSMNSECDWWVQGDGS